MKYLPMLILTLVLVGAGCSRAPETVVEVELNLDAGAVEIVNETKGMSAELQDGTYAIDSSISKVAWGAMKITGKGHKGEIAVSEGEVVLADGKIESGSVTMDMHSIVCVDLPEAKAKSLIEHLKSDDFFDVENHATAVFAMSSVEVSEDGEGTLTGTLTMRGTENEVSFPVTVSSTDSSLHVVGRVTIDRTEWGVSAQSGKLFANLGDNVVKDEVELALDVTWKK